MIQKKKNGGNLALNEDGGFYAIKNIEIGDELLFQYSYLNQYWKHRHEKEIQFESKKIFPTFPIHNFNPRNFIINEFVFASWKGGSDKKYQGKYSGYIEQIGYKNKQCKIIFDDGYDDIVDFSEIQSAEKICSYCYKNFRSKLKYDFHINKCKLV